jgi:hypothetical protein
VIVVTSILGSFPNTSSGEPIGLQERAQAVMTCALAGMECAGAVSGLG